MDDRNTEPQRWTEVPRAVYDPTERLKAMDADGIDCSVLYPTISGVGGEVLGEVGIAVLVVLAFATITPTGVA